MPHGSVPGAAAGYAVGVSEADQATTIMIEPVPGLPGTGH
jgi:hypothetical protein